MVSKKNNSSTVNEVFQWVKTILLAIVIAFLIRGFIFEPVYVDGESMEPTLVTGQRLIVYKTGYYFSPPSRGDVIVLQIEEGVTRFMPFLQGLPFMRKVIPDLSEVDYIKRVIGVPGDTIETRDGYVYVNGKKLDEPYIMDITMPGIDEAVTVPPNKVFVMGDNRQNSRDSRELGFIEYNRIKGKAVLRIFPFDAFGKIY
jgi:signal peptidase I